MRGAKRLLGVAGWALLWLPLAHAADVESPTYAVLSVIGDKISLIGHEVAVGSRLDRNDVTEIALTDRALDNMALVAASNAIKRFDTHAAVLLLASNDPKLYELQDRLFAREDQAAAVLESVRAMLQGQKATYLVLITKNRDEAALRLQNSYAGSGRIEGLGFYLDATVRIKDTKSGAIGRGFIAPFAYLKLILVDATTMAVIREQVAEASTSQATAHVPGTLNPWDALTREQKVAALKYVLDKAVAQGIPEVLRAK